MQEHLEKNADLVIQTLRPLSQIDFGFNAESVKWVEGYIDRLRERGQLEPATKRDQLIGVLGSFLGECMVRCHGGRWLYTEEDGWGVVIGDFTAYPFNKVGKQMDAGLEEGIEALFTCAPLVAKRHEIGQHLGKNMDSDLESGRQQLS